MWCIQPEMAGFATMEQTTGVLPTIRSYIKRGSRMTAAQEGAIDKYWEKYGLNSELPIDLTTVFPDKSEVIIEIGSGMGEATSKLAARFDSSGYIAIEVHRAGIGALILRAEELGITNLRVIEADATVVIRDQFSDQSIDAFHIFFPDPWPKTKQRKRRIIQEPLLDLLAKKLKPSGRICIATDWLEYAKAIEKVFARDKRFQGGIVARPEWRPLTKFESKGITKSHQVTDFRYTVAV
jgi:tRNA (guanine-N7-)-methyltransferase